MSRTPVFAAALVAACAATSAFAQPADTWTGPYVGASLGYSGGKMSYPASATFTPDVVSDAVSSDAVSTDTVSARAKLNSSGVIGGGLIGYDFHTSGVVIGLVADFSATGTEAKITADAALGTSDVNGTANGHIGSKLDYFGTVRARIGVPLAENRFMPYITGGFAYGRVTSSAGVAYSGTADESSGSGSLSIERKTNHTGWTLGAGAEYAVTQRIHFGVEYLYAELGTKEIVGGSLATDSISLLGTSLPSGTVDAGLSIKPTINIVRATISYRF